MSVICYDICRNKAATVHSNQASIEYLLHMFSSILIGCAIRGVIQTECVVSFITRLRSSRPNVGNVYLLEVLS